MKELDTFTHKHTAKHRHELMDSLSDIFAVGTQELHKSLGAIFSVGKMQGAKHQITNEVAKWEQGLQKQRNVI